MMWRGGLYKRFQMQNQAFVDGLRMRLLLSPTQRPQQLVHICRCGRDVDAEPFHLLDCPGNQWYFEKRHNVVCQLLGTLIKSCLPGVQVREEVILQQDEEHGVCRADIVATTGHNEFTIDVCISNPAANSYLLKNSDTVRDACAKTR